MAAATLIVVTTMVVVKEEALAAEETGIQEAETATEHHAETEVQEGKAVLAVKDVPTEEVLQMTERQETKDVQVPTEHLVVPTQMLQEKEDQEEANTFC